MHSIRSAIFSLTLSFAFSSAVLSDSGCFYLLESGEVRKVRSRAEIPYRYRSSSRCIGRGGQQTLAHPSDITLRGTVRREEIVSPLGVIELRWPRSVEELFGRTPLRAMADAATTASRALRHSPFPSTVGGSSRKLSVVFMDEELPEGEIPYQLVTNCHPAWMVPPAQIYVVGQRVAAGCGSSTRASSQVADSVLAQTLLHEIGHVIEYGLLPNPPSYNQIRAEGFAAWFEQYAANHSSMIRRGAVTAQYLNLARESEGDIGRSVSFPFASTPQAYARSFLIMHAIVSRRGVPGLVRVYETMGSDHVELIPAIEKTLGWDERTISKEMLRLLRSSSHDPLT